MDCSKGLCYIVKTIDRNAQYTMPVVFKDEYQDIVMAYYAVLLTQYLDDSSGWAFSHEILDMFAGSVSVRCLRCNISIGHPVRGG